MGALPQAASASLLGLTVPLRLAHLYSGATVSEDRLKWGVHPQNRETSITKLFEHYNLHLVETFVSPLQVPSSYGYAEFIGTQLDAGNDIVVGYDYASVFSAGANVGHVSLISEVDGSADLVWLVDPEDSGDDPRPVSMRRLITGIRAQKDGFWLIGTTESIAESLRVG